MTSCMVLPKCESLSHDEPTLNPDMPHLAEGRIDTAGLPDVHSKTT